MHGAVMNDLQSPLQDFYSTCFQQLPDCGPTFSSKTLIINNLLKSFVDSLPPLLISICLGIGSEVMCRPHAYQPVGSESTKTTGLYFFCLGLFAPYFERRCVRLATPAVSSVPRTM